MNITQRLAAALLFVGMGLPAFGQATTTPTPGPSGQRNHRKSDFQALGLSADQKSKIKQIRKTFPRGPERSAAIKKVLTPAQQAQWKAMRLKRKQDKQS